jgi:ATP phosphoribosyltransferase
VETGGTLQKHGLQELDIIFETDIVLVGRDDTIKISNHAWKAIEGI